MQNTSTVPYLADAHYADANYDLGNLTRNYMDLKFSLQNFFFLQFTFLFYSLKTTAQPLQR